jgi:hypothetical protein
MNPSVNPYTPFPGVTPTYLAGRGGDTKYVEGAVGQVENGRIGMHPIFIGEPGVGKTTMLTYAVKLALAQNWMVLSVEARSGYSVVDDLLDQVKTLVQGVSQNSPAGQRIKAWLGRVQSIQFSVMGSGAGVALTPTKSTPPVTQLFKELGNLAVERKTKVVFSVDEMDKLSINEMQLVLGAMHMANQSQMPLVIVGAGGESMRKEMAAAKGYGANIMLTKLQPLNYEEMSDALVKPAAALGVTVDPAAIKQISEAAKGNPFQLQQLAYHAWNFSKDKAIDLEAAIQAQSEVAFDTQQLDPTPIEEYAGVSEI